MSEKPPSYRDVLKDCFPGDPAQGITEARFDMPMDEYRIAPGIAPSDVKIASEEIGPRKWRGHFTRLANDRLARWYESHAMDLPPGLESTTGSHDQTLGSVYHSLLLEPDKFDSEYAMLSEEVVEELTAKRRERKMADAPGYSGRLKEAQDFKKEHGRLPETDEEKEIVLALAVKRHTEDDTFPKKEYEQWQVDQAAEGRTVIQAAVKQHAERMVDALHSHKENTEIGEYLKSIQTPALRAEVSIFAVAKMGSADDAPLIQLKGRPDMIYPGDDILDPKTALCVHPEAFSYAVETYNYDLSMAGYVLLSEMLEGHESAEGLDFPKRRAGFLAQEKTPPYLARIHWLPDDWLYAAKRRYKTELMKLANLWRSNQWSGIEMANQIGNLIPSPWKEKEIEMYS